MKVTKCDSVLPPVLELRPKDASTARSVPAGQDRVSLSPEARRRQEDVCDRMAQLAWSIAAGTSPVDLARRARGLARAGVAVPPGAAGASGAVTRAHVLEAMKLPRSRIESAIRFSMGAGTTESEIRATLDILARLVEQLREGPATDSE